MASENKTESQDNPEHINLKVMGQDGNIVQFKIKRHTALKKLMSTYCERAGLALQTIRFSFDGTRINESDTPKSLDMEDGDTIEVFQQQSGGGELQSGGGDLQSGGGDLQSGGSSDGDEDRQIRGDLRARGGEKDSLHILSGDLAQILQSSCHTHSPLKANVCCSFVQLT